MLETVAAEAAPPARAPPAVARPEETPPPAVVAAPLEHLLCRTAEGPPLQ
jgi:hypothetical protein